jgi:hypothetical protein
VIASMPVRMFSLMVVAFVVLAAARGISSGVASGGGLLDGAGASSRSEPGAAGPGRTTQGE